MAADITALPTDSLLGERGALQSSAIVDEKGTFQVASGGGGRDTGTFKEFALINIPAGKRFDSENEFRSVIATYGTNVGSLDGGCETHRWGCLTHLRAEKRPPRYRKKHSRHRLKAR